jgi:pimeloyl-ACP methyl ester carboxylesterase
VTSDLLFLGGSGHCAARIEAARRAAGRRGLTIHDAAYPGFEGRIRARSLEAFLAALESGAAEAPVVYATGIGGLLALCLRARGAWRERRLVLQAPVLWGLEHRFLPRLLRVPLARGAVQAVFSWRGFRDAFVRRQFQRPLSPVETAAFFEGYARCAALPDFFAWLTPALLRELEQRFAADATALSGIELWWGARDRVVTLAELRWTEAALGVKWPRHVFADWGHYPMIDDPEGWADIVVRHL